MAAAAVAEPTLSAGGVTVRRATAADDEDIRSLLHDRPMDGAIRIALTRDPDWRIAAAVEGERGLTLAFHRARDGRFLGFAGRSVRRRYVEGRPTWVGYLGQLRAVERSVGPHRLRLGYRLFREARQPDETPFDLTAILADNLPARRLLERGLPGLPPYRPLAELETLIVPTARRGWRGWRVWCGLETREGSATVEPTAADRPSFRVFLAFLETIHARRPFAPVWRAEDFAGTGPGPADIFLLRQEGNIVAAGALWDQRAFKQTVIQGYAPWLGTLRPLVNVGLWATGQPTLPRPGSVLPLAYLACLAVADEEEDIGLERATALIEGIRREARRRGLGQVAFTLPAHHPLTAPLRRRFAARPYRSILYAVVWEGECPPLEGFPHVEAALL